MLLKSNKFLKRTAFASKAFIALAACVIIPAVANSAALYEDKKTQTVTSGVIHEQISRMYESGWVNIQTLRIDLKNPNVRLDVLESITETGLKETVSSLAQTGGAVAAANGDFFGNTTLSSSMGIVVNEGKIEETRNYYNSSGQTYAGIYIDSGNTPYIDYLKISYIGVLTNGSSKLEIDAKNKVTDMKRPIYVDRAAMPDTSKLDSRFNGLYKIVVDNGIIVDISAANAVKAVPENGFLIVMNAQTAAEKLKDFNLGDEVRFEEFSQFLGNTSLSVADIKFGISGGGKIIENGQYRDNGLIIEPGKRHPRTAVGINEAKTELIIAAIDGRSGNSLGATHYETYEIMKSLGSHDAFHLDGGGSTTLVSRNEGQTELSIQNDPSGGTQRKVANAIGVKTANAPGSLAGLYVTAAGSVRGSYTGLSGQAILISAAGYDTNYNPVPVSGINFTQSGTGGTFNGSYFTPQAEGETVITAETGGVTGTITIKALAPATGIRITPGAFTAAIGDSVQLKAEIVNIDGYGVDITEFSTVWGVSGGIGTVEGAGLFKASGNGTGTVSVSYGGLTGAASAAVGGYTKNLLDFETVDSISYLDGSVPGAAAYTTSFVHDGSYSLAIDYTFNAKTTAKQTASVDFRSAYAEITETPDAFAFWLTGDAANSAVSAAFRDGTGKDHVFSFPTKMDNGDWKYYYGKFPEKLPLPVSLSFITITAADNLPEPVNAKVYLDTLHVAYSYAPDYTARELYSDYMRAELNDPPQADEIEIALFGPTANITGDLKKAAFDLVVAKMQQNSNLSVFAGYTAELPQMVTEVVRWPDAYTIKDMPNVRIITLATSKGGMRETDASQWTKLKGDLRNSPSGNVIVVLNKDIWDKSNGFGDNKERDLFHKTLKEYKDETGANVLAVSGISSQTKGYIRDGIRYITLNGLVTENNEIGAYKILRVRVQGDTMTYDLEDV